MRQMCKVLLTGFCTCVHVYPCVCVLPKGNIKCFPLLLSPLFLGDSLSPNLSAPEAV